MDVAERLFEIDADQTWLIAARDRTTGAVRFPFPEGGETARCDAVRLPPTGILWSWTVQRFAPKPPFEPRPDAAFAPYGVGYVQLGDVLIVEGRIVTDDLDALHLGQPMRVVTEVFTTTASGEPVRTYAFRPISEEGGQ
jgi:uncharacterized OB-fold protein